MPNNARYLLALVFTLSGLLALEECRLRHQPATQVVITMSPADPSPPVATPSSVSTPRPEQSIPKPKALAWADIESTDYQVYIANLRKLACPEQTIRDIITADVNALYAKRRKDLVARPGGMEYWRPAARFAEITERNFADAFRNLDDERRRVLRELLGADVPPDPAPTRLSKAELNEAALDFLSGDKKAKVLAWLNSSDEQYQAGVQKRSGEDSRSAYRQWKADRTAQVEANLTPAEREEYDLRFSERANWLRFRFGPENLTSDQFRELVQFAHPYEDALDLRGLDTTDAEDNARLAGAKRALVSKFREMTGTDPAVVMPDATLARRYGLIPSQ